MRIQPLRDIDNLEAEGKLNVKRLNICLSVYFPAGVFVSLECVACHCVSKS